MVLLLYLVRDVLAPFALAAVFAYLVNPLVNAFEARQMPRSVAILLVYAIFAVGAGLMVYWIVPTWIKELHSVLGILPQAAANLERMATRWLEYLARLPGNELLRGLAMDAVQRGELWLSEFAANILNTLLSLLPKAFTLVLTPFLAFYILRDLAQIRRAALSVVPEAHRDELLRWLRDIHRAIGGFLRGQLIVSVFVGAMVAIGLLLLRVEYALLIGAFAGLFDIIPYFGPIIGGVPAVALGLLKSPGTAVWVVVVIVVANQVEGAVLQPRIMGNHVGLHPLTVIFAVLAGGELLGIWGMLLAVPVAAVIKVTGTFLLDRMISPTLP